MSGNLRRSGNKVTRGLGRNCSRENFQNFWGQDSSINLDVASKFQS